MYLLDTNIILLLAPRRSPAMQEVIIAEWIERFSSDLYLSLITIAEMETGIARLRRMGAHSKALSFGSWLEKMISLYSARIHELDLDTARLAGQLYDRAVAGGSNAAFPDAAIAATAKMHGLTVITRNTAHFRFFEVPFINPYDELPAHD